MKKILLALWALPCAFLFADSTKSTEEFVIRGKAMGHAMVSPALQREIEAKYGKQDGKNGKQKDENTAVTKHGFAYVPKHSEKKSK